MKKVVSLLLTVLMTLCVLSVNVLALEKGKETHYVTVKYVVNTDPVLTVPSEKTIFKGEKFNPFDVASAKDEEDGDLSASISVSGQFDVNTVGSYTLTYSVTDKLGSTVTKTLKLNVIEKLKEENTSEQVTVKEDAPVKEVEADIKTDSIVDSVVREEGNKTSTLTPEQKQAIKDGASVKIELTVDSTADVSTNEDSKVIDKAIKETNSSTAIGALLDINLLCTVTKNNESLGTSKITVTSEPVKVTVTVPDTLVNTDSTVNRDYDVARLHDGKVDLLGATYDAANKKLTFSTTKFSTYAIVYTDTKVEQPKNNTSSSSSSSYKKPVVNTGYGFNPSNIEIFGNSGSTKFVVEKLPECNVLGVKYDSEIELKSAEDKTVKAKMEFVKEIKADGNYTLTVKLQDSAAKPAPGIYEGKIAVEITNNEYEAKIGDKYYDTLKNAIDVAQNSDTIIVLKNLQVDSQFVISKKINLDLNKKTVSYNGDNVLESGIFKVEAGGDLSIYGNGSVLTGDKAYAALVVFGDGSTTPAKLTVENGTFQGYYYPIAGNGKYHNTEITINGGSFSSINGLCIYHPQNGTLIINGGTFEGQESAIEVRSGNLIINGGEFVSTADSFSCNANGSGTTTTGAAIAIAQHTTKKDISVTITNGTFRGIKALNESNPQNNDPTPQVTLNVSGGTFDGEVSAVDSLKFITGGTFSQDPSTHLANGYRAVNNGESSYYVERDVLAYMDNYSFYEIDSNGNKIGDSIFSVDFSTEDDVEKFCPYIGHGGDNSDSSTHDNFVTSFAIRNEIAEIYKNSAWKSFKNIDSNKKYEISYDLKIDEYYNRQVSDGTANVLGFDFGEANTWAGARKLLFAKDGEELKVYLNDFSDMNAAEIEPDKNYKIKISFSQSILENSKHQVIISVNVIDSSTSNTVYSDSFSHEDSNAFDNYYWDIYYSVN